jgi:2-polyprenyl-6-methoxyphenol hydroxylase-like FAD-dependent oxidoreductase
VALDYSTKSVRRADAAPTRLNTDLCVLGSGVAGVAAALETARMGRRVVLVDGAPQLGGLAVGAMVGTFCGFYSNGPKPRLIQHGVAEEILHDLRASGDTYDIARRNTIIVQYRVTALQRWIEEAVHKAGITVVLGAVLESVRREGKRIARLELATRYGPVEVEARGFVDASGDAALAWTAGLECREPSKKIFGTNMFTLEGFDPEALTAFDRAVLHKRLEEKGRDYGVRRQDGFLFAAPGRDEALVNMTHVETPLDPVGASRAMLDGRDQVDRLVRFLRAEFPEVFAKVRVRTYALPGIRQTRWIAGLYQLTAADVREGRSFDDTIARASWPIELHDRPEGVYWEVFGDDHMHSVPFRSLIHAEADNLVAAGRCMDADPVALSAVRVMGPCIAMGTAAAHALDIAGSGSVHQLDLGELKRRLAPNLTDA